MAAPPPGYTTIELLTPAGPEFRRVSTAPPRPATRNEIPVIDLHGMLLGVSVDTLAWEWSGRPELVRTPS